MIHVHDIKPPFLDGKQVFTTQLSTISVVKDPTSDLAILAKKGSSVVKSLREKNDRNKMRERFWELAGSKLGDLLKVQKTEEEQDMEIQEEDYDYKKSSQYGDALSQKNAAVSDFARFKSIKQQREFLPVYSIKEELMQVIQENKVSIIVGETGSGKTTQLT